MRSPHGGSGPLSAYVLCLDMGLQSYLMVPYFLFNFLILSQKLLQTFSDLKPSLYFSEKTASTKTSLLPTVFMVMTPRSPSLVQVFSSKLQTVMSTWMSHRHRIFPLLLDLPSPQACLI